MADEQNRRATDQGVAGQVRAHATTIWDWADKRKIAAHAAMAVALYLTIRVVEWALNLPYDVLAAEKPYSGTDVAAIQAAVLTPWGLMQAAMFKFYADLIRSNGNGHVG